MNAIARYTFLVGLLLMIIPLFVPIWEIYLEAPQYPDPIGMYISIDNVRGIGEYDLENINLLNHYIGMKKIIPESIPELRFMKYVIYGFLSSGIVVFFFKKKWLLYIWTLALIITAFIALYDFNLWEHNYGHDLDPMAPIKVPGMSYKPPLLGKKHLLNITATSLPSSGGIAFIACIILASSASVIAYFSNKDFSNTHKPTTNTKIELEKPFI